MQWHYQLLIHLSKPESLLSILFLGKLNLNGNIYALSGDLVGLQDRHMRSVWGLRWSSLMSAIPDVKPLTIPDVKPLTFHFSLIVDYDPRIIFEVYEHPILPPNRFPLSYHHSRHNYKRQLISSNTKDKELFLSLWCYLNICIHINNNYRLKL